jgi:hypothetical protein
LTRPARSHEEGNYWSDQVHEHEAALGTIQELGGFIEVPPSARIIRCTVARFVAHVRYLIRRQPHDAPFPPNSNGIAVAFVALKSVSDRCAKRALDPIQILDPLGGSESGIQHRQTADS